jgi:hypothetical protein
VSAGEAQRLAALERTLVQAAEQQARRRRVRRRRVVVLLVVAAPLTLAAAGSVAATGFFGSVDRHLSTLRDDRLQGRPGAVAQLATAAGAVSRDTRSVRSWPAAGQHIEGYTTQAGKFCFRFRALMGGCVRQGTLNVSHPVEAFTDNGPGLFRIYGLAIDGVTAVSVRVRGKTRRASVGRNAFFLSANALSAPHGVSGTVIVRFEDGTTHERYFRAGGYDLTQKPTPKLPGGMPVGDTAA